MTSAMDAAPVTESAPAPPGRRPGPRVGALGAWWILLGGVIGLVAAFTLTVEKIELLLDPSYVPSCSINPVLSCGSVMSTHQASLLGFPNPLIGVIAFTVVVTGFVIMPASLRLTRSTISA